MRDPYFSIHGNDTEGWRVMIYEWVVNPAAPDLGNVDKDKLTTRPGWGEPKYFDSLNDLILALNEFKENQNVEEE